MPVETLLRGAPAGETVATREVAIEAGGLLAGLGLIPLHDARRDSAAVGDVDALALGPVTDGLVLFAAGPSRCATAAGTAGGHEVTAADPAGLRDELGQRAPQLLGVLGAQVNLVAGTVKGERHRLVGPAAVDVVQKLNLHLARHHGAFLFAHRSNHDRTRS